MFPGDTAIDDFGSEVKAYISVNYNNVSSKWAQNEDYEYFSSSYTHEFVKILLGHVKDHSAGE